MHTPSAIERSKGNSDLEDEEHIPICNLKGRTQDLLRFSPPEAAGNEQQNTYIREQSCSLCNNLDEECCSRNKGNEYVPVFIDNAAGYLNDYHYKKDMRNALELERHDSRTRERQRGPSPIVIDHGFRKQMERNSKRDVEFIHHPTFYNPSTSPTHQVHLSPRCYCSRCKYLSREPFRHDSLSPDVTVVEATHGSHSPTQVEMMSLTSSKDYHSTQCSSKSSCSPTPSGSPCSSTPGTSTSPLPRRSSSNAFCPATPIPMCLPISNSTYEGYHNSYYSWPLRNPCFQRFPYYFPPSPVLPMQPDMKHAISCYGVGMEANGYSYEAKRNPQKKLIRDHAREPPSPSNAEVELNTDVESPMVQKLSNTEHQADNKVAQQKLRTMTLQVDVAMEENEEQLSLERSQSMDENDNIVNDKVTSEEEESINLKTPKGRKFTCKFCGKIYVSLGALKMHIRTHTLPCKCHICGKAFSRPWLLQGHIRTHTGEKPYKCHMCQRAFADRSNLRAHLQTHSDVKKYRCRTCHKTFSRMSLLLKHEEAGCLAS